MTEEKSQFVENIKKWVALDSQIKSVNEKVKKARISKHQLLENITHYVQKNQLENTKIEISDGELRFCNKKEYQQITFSYIETCLSNIIPDKKQVEYILNYLKEHREIKVVKDIQRKYDSVEEKTS